LNWPPRRVTRVGFWTRTMGSSAEIESFQIVTDGGETVGRSRSPARPRLL
jgi:hypothetical protein